VGILEIFDGDLRYLMGVLEIFYRCLGDINLVSWRYFIGVLEIFDLCLGDT